MIGVLLMVLSLSSEAFEIEELEFKKTQVMDIIRVLAEDAQKNIIATPEAAEKEVTLFLRKVTLEEAIKAICRISGLWYRYDREGAGTFRLMTKEQYSKDLVVGQDDTIRVFPLRNPNVLAIASAIEDLYGSRVEVSYGSGISSGNTGNQRSNRGGGRAGGSGNRFGGRNNGGRNNNGRNNGRNNRGNASGINSEQMQLLDDLTVEQLEALASGGKQLEVGQVASVSGKNTLIYVTINIEHNLLIVKTSDMAILKSIASLVEQLDRTQTQVLLEMKIIDIKVGEDFDALFNIELMNTKLTGKSTNPIILGGSAALSGGGSLVYEYISNNIKANIEFLEQNNRVNVISKPMLVASNHRPATLFVGEERIMVRGYSIDTIDTNNNSRTVTTPETELEDIGTTLEVTPHINDDGSVHIILKQENATLNEAAAFIPVTDGSGGVVELPIDTISTARMQGEIFAKHGFTVAVGGLIRDSFSRSRRKVPFFADIPLIGNIFRSTQDEQSKSEMVLLITPYILSQGEAIKGVDPTETYHHYAPGEALEAKELPKQGEFSTPVCGEYCAPLNLRQSDL